MLNKSLHSLHGLFRLVCVTLALSMAVSQFGCGAPPVPPAATTVLVYMIGSDLETDDGQATANIEEMKKAALSPSVKVVLTTGGSKKAGWRTLKRQIVQNGTMTELADLGAVDMGQPDTLKDFIVWGQTTYPADKYILVLWDHGGGPNGGYGVDELTKNGLSTTAYTKAIADATAATKKTFEIIGFDACLMGTAEIASNLAPYAKYLVASEELEPGSGWDYTVFLNSASDPAAVGLSIGKNIADGYAAKCKSSNAESYTLSVVEMAGVGPVVTALDSLGAQMKDRILAAGQTAWVAIAGARNLTDEYGADYVNKKYFENTADIVHFSTLLDTTDSSYTAATASLRTAVANAVKYAVKGTAHPLSNGLAFYLPLHDFKGAELVLPTYKSFPFSVNYQTLVQTYTQYPLTYPANPPMSVSDIVVTGSKLNATASSPFALASQFIGLMKYDAVANTITTLGMDLATATLAGTDSFALGYTRDDKWFTLQGNPVTVIIDMKGNGPSTTYSVSVPVFHRRTGTAPEQNKAVNLGFLYDYQTNTGRITSAWEGILPSGAADRVNVELKWGDIITPAFSMFSLKTGEWSLVAGTPFVLTETSINIQFARTATTPGTYTFYFQAEDLTGTTILSKGVDLPVPMAPTGKMVAPTISAIPALPATTEGFWSHWTR
jgi:hypothetical protein